MENLNVEKQASIENLQNKTVLVVDDEETYRKFTSKILEKYLKCKVVSCSNPKEAFEYLNHNIPDLIIMDLQMPVMDGLTAVKYIRAAERTAKIPVVVCSALGFETVIKTLAQYNVTNFIVKPADAQTIISKIVKMFNDIDQK
jgi:CheY-like chemotaxis protein